MSAWWRVDSAAPRSAWHRLLHLRVLAGTAGRFKFEYALLKRRERRVRLLLVPIRHRVKAIGTQICLAVLDGVLIVEADPYATSTIVFRPS
jgi:hypothetical protein